MNDTAWGVICPACRAGLGELQGEEDLVCPSCAATYTVRNGIWDFLLEKRRALLDQFLSDYLKVRLAEGRGSDEPGHYLALPDCSPAHPLFGQWRIRQRTYSGLVHRVLPSLGDGLRMLDLGAGVGWLSYRMAQRGHRPCAVDINTDNRDGLGAARHYAPRWPRIRAEFDRLPFPPQSVDLVVFNASLHYSTSYLETLAEALRVLGPGGCIVVLETPVYQKQKSGRQMVEDRHAWFEKQFGTRSDTVPNREFLTWGELEALGAELGIEWKIFYPWYGLRWAARPWLAWLKGKREPSRFPILLGRAPRQ